MSTSTVQHLGVLLADFHILYQKLRGYHWNVQGPMFFELHEEFEELFGGVADTIDEIAERIRGLGDFPPATYAEYLKLATLKEDPTRPAAAAMVANLAADYDRLLASAAAVRKVAEAADDEETADFLTGLRQGLQKTLWMLRSNVA